MKQHSYNNKPQC